MTGKPAPGGDGRIFRLRPGPRMSQATAHTGTLYLAGQIALAAPHAPVEEQMQLILDQIDTILDEGGSSRELILSTTIWLTDMADFAAMNAVWEAWLPAGSAPARATVGAALALPGLKVEVAVTAAQR